MQKQIFSKKIIRKLLSKKQYGIALLTVLLSITILSAIISDLSYGETVKYRIAVNSLNALKAESLAMGAVEIELLLLSLNSTVQPMLSNLASMGVPLPKFTFWELLPVNSDHLASLSKGNLYKMAGIEIDSALKQREEENLFDQSPSKFFTPPATGFGAFDDGFFEVKAVDEESKISLRNFASTSNIAVKNMIAQNIFNVLSQEKYRYLFDEPNQGQYITKQDLIKNIYNYIDSNDVVDDPLASKLSSSNIGLPEMNSSVQQSKNAYFDSFDELRLVSGVNDNVMKAFNETLSIYGQGNKINILSATDASIGTLIVLCNSDKKDIRMKNPEFISKTVSGWKKYKKLGVIGGGGAANENGFISFLKYTGIKVDNKLCKDIMTTESQNFMIVSEARVGEVTKKIKLVVRVVRANEELYFFENY